MKIKMSDSNLFEFIDLYGLMNVQYFHVTNEVTNIKLTKDLDLKKCDLDIKIS